MKVLFPYQQEAVNSTWDAIMQSDDPVCLSACVGAGKSLMISELLLKTERHNRFNLCLIHNSELVRSNHHTHCEQGGDGSIFCASLGEKDISGKTVFATPHTMLAALKRNHPIGERKISLIIVDECHMISYKQKNSMFMRVLRHYKQNNPQMRLIGATGTAFRFGGESIVGENSLFKRLTADVKITDLLPMNRLAQPVFGVDRELSIDFGDVNIKRTGRFDEKQLAEKVDKSTRLTKLIVEQVMEIMRDQNRFGCILFASTAKHAKEIMSYLPAEQTALILGDVDPTERTRIFDQARRGELKYIVNINIVSTGVDIPAFDTIAYLRPTESLNLLIQTMGRVLRCAPGKDHCLILDYAGNIDRHRDWDDPLLMDAVAQTEPKELHYIFKCPQCETMNNENARRCIGITNKSRCDHYFEFKECSSCSTPNDITARNCRNCEFELIDPNAKLSINPTNPELIHAQVIEAKYWCKNMPNYNSFHAKYKVIIDGEEDTVMEHFIPNSDSSKRFFYGSMLKQCLPDAAVYLEHLSHHAVLKSIASKLNTPNALAVERKGSKYKIKKRIFL